MITTSDFSKGTRILIGDEPYQIVDLTVQSPSLEQEGIFHGHLLF